MRNGNGDYEIQKQHSLMTGKFAKIMQPKTNKLFTFILLLTRSSPTFYFSRLKAARVDGNGTDGVRVASRCPKFCTSVKNFVTHWVENGLFCVVTNGVSYLPHSCPKQIHNVCGKYWIPNGCRRLYECKSAKQPKIYIFILI